MNVSLTAELEQFINAKVESGLYSSASEVVREGLRLLKAEDDERALKLEALRHDVELGLAQVDDGHGIPGHKAFARLRAKRRDRKVS
jgi:antitoxin ParD1/3/4